MQLDAPSRRLGGSCTPGDTHNTNSNINTWQMVLYSLCEVCCCEDLLRLWLAKQLYTSSNRGLYTSQGQANATQWQ